MSDDQWEQRWRASESERKKALDALNEAIYALAGLVADKDSEYTAHRQSAFARVLTVLVDARANLKS